MACACNFSIAGVAPGVDHRDGGSSPPTVTPGADAATAPDLATSVDLATPKPDMTSPPDQVGDACAGSCGSGLTCMSWVPAGYCSESCDGSSTVCPNGSSCVDIGNGSHYCLLDANGDGKCMRTDLRCLDCGAQVCGPSGFCDGC